MFDLRYHVASLAAVFLALVLGIIIGAAISDPSLADRAENQRLEDTVAGLRSDLSAAELRARQASAAAEYATASYQAVVHDRLTGDDLLFVSIGPVGERIDEASTAVADAGGRVARTSAIAVPADAGPIVQALDGRAELESYADPRRLRDLGRAFARELVDGGDTPLVDALDDVLVQQRSPGDEGESVDGVVVARSVEPHSGPVAPFLVGLYEGLRDGTPAVAVELSSSPEEALRAFRRAGLSTVNAVDAPIGKVALVLLLAGAPAGDYGIGTETVVPPIEPHVPDDSERGG